MCHWGEGGREEGREGGGQEEGRNGGREGERRREREGEREVRDNHLMIAHFQMGNPCYAAPKIKKGHLLKETHTHIAKACFTLYPPSGSFISLHVVKAKMCMY